MSHSIPNRQRNHRSSKGLPCSTALSPSDAAPEKRHGTMLHGPEIAPWQKIQLINPSEKKSVGIIIPNILYGRIKHVPNHQPVIQSVHQKG